MKLVPGIFLSVTLLLFCLTLQAQTEEWIWAARAGGTGEDYAYDIVADSQGNQYVTGDFEETADFGATSLTSSGNKDIFVAKLDADGNWIWAKRAGGTAYDYGQGIVLDDAGNIYVTGYFRNVADFGDISLTSNGYDDIFVAKLDPEGNWIWASSAGDASSDSAQGITIDASGNLYITGLFLQSTTIGSTTLTSSGGSDIYVAKLESGGNWQWAVRAGGSSGDSGRSISSDGANLYITGDFRETAAFGDDSLTSSGMNDIYLAKLDPDGNWIWALRAGGTANDEGYCVKADNPGMINLTGCFRSTADFGPHNLTSNGGFDIFAAGLNGNGEWYGANRAGGTDSDHSYGIASDSAGNAVIIGDFAETADFGPFSMTSFGGYDAFVMKIDEGNVILARQAGGTSEDWGTSVATDPSGNIYATGYFNETAEFGDNSITSAGSDDIFVAKLSTEVDADDPMAPGLTGNSRLHDAYPNPFRAGGSLSIKADIAENESGMIQFFNLRGQKMAQFELPAGRQQVSLETGGLRAGVYLYRLKTGSTDIVKKLVLID